MKKEDLLFVLKLFAPLIIFYIPQILESTLVKTLLSFGLFLIKMIPLFVLLYTPIFLARKKKRWVRFYPYIFILLPLFIMLGALIKGIIDGMIDQVYWFMLLGGPLFIVIFLLLFYSLNKKIKEILG